MTAVDLDIMADISPEPSAEVIEEIKIRLASTRPQIPILRPGEFCESDTFFDNLSSVVVYIISKVSMAEPSSHQSELCSRTAESELMRSIRFNSSISLESAIALGSVAVKYAQKEDPQLGIIISMFGRTLRRRWQISKEDKHLDEAIYYFQKTIEFEPLDEPNRPLHYDDLACALLERYILHHNDIDFQEAKFSHEAAAATLHDAVPAFLSNLGRLLKEKALFVQSERDVLLDESFKRQIQAITSATPEFRGSMRYIYMNLAQTYLEIYVFDENNPNFELPEELEGKVRPTGNLWMFFYELGVILGNKFLPYSQPFYAKGSIELLRRALAECPDNKMVNSALADILQQYGIALRSPDMVTDAYQLHEVILKETDEYDSQYPSRLQSISLALTKRFELGGVSEDLDKAISFTERGLALPAIGDTQRWKFQQILGLQLGYRFELMGRGDDLEKALSTLKTAIEFKGLSKSDKAATLREYGKVLFQKYKDSRKEDDLEQAMISFKTAIDLWDGRNDGVPSCINDLGNAMLVKFENTAQFEHVLQAIDQYLEGLSVLESFPILFKTDKHMFYTGLGNAFFAKFEVWDQGADLNQAVFYFREAVKHTSQTDLRLPSRIGRLSRALQQKFRLTKDKDFLDQSQVCIKTVIAAPNAPITPPDTTFLQNILGISYLHAFDESDGKDVSLFDKAAACFQAAIDSGCTQPILINPPLVNLMRTLIGKFQVTRTDEDLIRAMKEMLKRQPLMMHPSHRDLRSLSDTFAKCALLIYEHMNNMHFGQMALMQYQLIAMDAHSVPERRIWSSLQAARLNYEVLQQPATARNVLVRVLNLLPEAILMGPNRGDQLRAAKELSSLPGFILSFSLAAGDDAGNALRLFELSRSLIWNRLMDLKTDLTDLHQKHGDLANSFEHARERLSRARPQSIATESSARWQLQLHELAFKYNEVVRLIRQQEGFEHFMLLETPSRLIDHASQGPIVVLNATKYRADAVMVTSEGIVSIPLPQFTFDNCIQEATRLRKALLWLWDAAAGPVLDELGMTGGVDANQKLPRIWWLINGWINLFPIHAAGDHPRALETGEPCTVMDRAISSYIPTIRALDYVRKSSTKRSSVVEAITGSAVLIKMPTTLDGQDLPNVVKEISAIEEILNQTFQITSLDRPKKRDVLPLLETSSMAHFACHGDAHHDDPSLSNLKLQDWKTNPLNIRAILQSPMKRLEFVYLSACETAASNVSELQEESIHISAAFQMAGVPYTVASLWSIEDNLSAQVAADFYSFLTLERGLINFEKSAEALHSAILRARNGGVDALLWGAFVHSGA